VHKAGANKHAHPAGNGEEWNSSRKVAHDGRGFRNTIPREPGLAKKLSLPFTGLTGSLI
jgi:hypothetical protein